MERDLKRRPPLTRVKTTWSGHRSFQPQVVPNLRRSLQDFVKDMATEVTA